MFSLKGPGSPNIKLANARGLVGPAYARRPGIIAIEGHSYFDYTSLSPGEETAVFVTLDDLPANADVKTFQATLKVQDGFTPPPEKTDVKIKQGDAKELAVSVTTNAPLRPRNVSIKLDQGEPLWNFGGSLVNDSYDLGELAKHVNAYLDKVTPDGSRTTLKFIVKSDTAGRVKINVGSKSLTRLQTQSWPNELDQTVRVDRNLTVDFGQRLEVPLDPITAAPAQLVAVRLDAAGTFGAERMLGRVPRHDGHDFATLSSDYALAQGFVLDQSLKAVGLSGAFIAETDAELYIELQPDADGAPASGPPLAKSNLVLSSSAAGAPASFLYTEFAAPTDLHAGAPYWIVVKGVNGTVWLGVQASDDMYLRQLLVNRSGKLWKRFDRSGAEHVALLRLVYLPEPDNQSAAIRIGINDSFWQSVDPVEAPANVSFGLTGSGRSAAILVVESQARGALTVANVTQEY